MPIISPPPASADFELSGSYPVDNKPFADPVELSKNQPNMEAIYLRDSIEWRHNFRGIIGRSKAIEKSIHAIRTVAPTDASVLILGETGTGKELAARAMHELSQRKPHALIKVNCAAIPLGLVESELFGHEKGAFTGALSQKIGRFELANKGTIFLDEIGELPIELQPKLLRVLQEGEFERVGGSRTIKVNARVIAATNRQLEEAVQLGRFREDLYYRLNVFPIALPPLRARRDDIPLLTQYFVIKHSQQLAKKIDRISSEAIDALKSYPWPGNVRELENVIERAVILSQGPWLDLGDALSHQMLRVQQKPLFTLNDIERSHISEVLKLTNGRVSGDRGAAKILGLKATTLESRMKRLGVVRH